MAVQEMLLDGRSLAAVKAMGGLTGKELETLEATLASTVDTLNGQANLPDRIVEWEYHANQGK